MLFDLIMGGYSIHLLSIGSNTGKGLTHPHFFFMDPSQPASSASGLPSSSSREEPTWVVETARRLDEARAKMRALKKSAAQPYIAAPVPGTVLPFGVQTTAHPETMLRAIVRGGGLGLLNPSIAPHKHTTFVHGRPCQAQALVGF